MRRSVTLLKRQDVCFLCSFELRYGARHVHPRSRLTPQGRCFSTPVAKPAGAAVARQEDDDADDYPALPSTTPFQPPANKATPKRSPSKLQSTAPDYESLPDWKCRCGHVNLSRTLRCTICEEPRRRSAQLVFPHKPAGSRKPISKKGFRSIFSTAPAVDLPRPQDQKVSAATEGRFSVFGRSHGGSTNATTDAGAGRRFGAFMDNVSEKHQSQNRRTDAGQPSISYLQEGKETSEPRNSKPDSKTIYSATGLPPTAWRHQSTKGGRTEDITTGTPATGQFIPFVRKIKPREDDARSSAMSINDISEQGSLPRTETGVGATIMPPADSSFDSYEDERRKKRNERFDRRSQMYELDHTDADEVQKAGGRDKSAKTRRRPQQEVDDEAFLLEDEFEERRKKKTRKPQAPIVHLKPTLQLPDFISVEQLSRVLKVRVDHFLRKLEEEGFEGARYDHILDAESSAMIADVYGFEASFGGRQTLDDLVPQPEAEDRSLLPPRPPVVTIMGHVDHGKTTILDWLRKSSVVATEHGGITQHIGAFSVTMPGSERQITFLDTPGHAAFLDMRRRGAVVTDIVVLVVAADDSVKPQTVEAIKHALEAKVHIVVAINKVDKEDANITRVKQDLANNGIIVEEYGGDYQAIELSGKTGKGMEELEEAILTLADVSDFRADTGGQAEGWILESKVTPAGRVATILVRRGTLRVGDFIVAGTTWARVKTLRNDAGILVDEALPGTPVQVDGWRGEDPTAGLEVLQAENEEHAKEVVDIRFENLENQRIAGDLAVMNSMRSEEAEARAKVLAWEAEQTWAKKKRKPVDNEGWVEGATRQGAKLVHFVVKADVAGSVEALVAAVSAVGNNEIRANIVHSGTGLLSESDIRRLAATGETAYAISFNQPVDGAMLQLARAAGLQILNHNVIYKLTDEVKEKLSAELPPLITQRVLGEAEIGKVFEITTKHGKVKVAGCKINNGSISRSHKTRVLRNGETVYTGKLESLKNVKKDVTEMRKGSECGMGFDGWEDFEEGDQVQTFEEERSARKLY